MESATLTSPFEKPIPFSCLQVVKFPTAGFSLRSTIRFLFYRINFPNSLIAFFGAKFSFILWTELRDSNSVVSTESSAFLSLFIGRVRYPIAHTAFSTSSFWISLCFVLGDPAATFGQLPCNSLWGFDERNQQNDLGAVVRSGREILFQAFNWESHKYDWWRNLEMKVPDIAKCGFTSAWLPPATHSFAPQGYVPQNLYSLNSSYGSEHQLRALLQKMKQYKVRAMADIVINHRCGTTQGHGGMYNRYDGIPLPWDEHAVTSCTGGLGNQSTGDNFHGFPNIDHSQQFVRKDITAWLQWLRNSVGFQDFRFDFARGYSAKYVKEYIEGAKPLFSVGEYWDSCNYNGHGLDYNQDNHRQRIINWIDGTGQLSTAFDFTTKGILQEAVKGQLWRLRDPQGKPPGLMGWWPSRAVTFLDNHDTGSTQAHWPFPSNHILEDIHSRSSIRIMEAQPNLYSAIIGENVCMKIGDGSWCPTGREWSLATCGHGYAVWQK
ncbi:putative alpha-amylase 2 [Quercus suber]|uniref:alpha-amylase n=1 Tax=Quercus suber TaxID=58331 RepID=A0AAW0LEW1_QUESU